MPHHHRARAAGRRLASTADLASTAALDSFLLPALAHVSPTGAQPEPPDPGIAEESPARRDARMAWWRDARFGMFIHWGLYAVPAGTWKGRPVGGIGEWIQHIGRIPGKEYDTLLSQFDPVEFDAAEWVRIAKDAGMRYIVITTKHHDGFALFDSALSDFDVMATPFGRDIMKELSEAARTAGLRICWYHSILDWHHPDYLPRTDWSDLPVEGADFDRYRAYLKGQVTELLTNYGDIGVMWFDGEWEPMWTHEHGVDLYRHVRSLQPRIIVNNRVDKGRQGMRGLTREGFAGDFGTPEQEIPPTGLPGADWETCMTMNDTWGYKADDHNWKSVEDLLRKLADIASKGGNFLLNVGPTGRGRIPPASVERLEAMGRWMRRNGEAIYGTSASPFAHLPWGRCTQKPIPGGTRLYLHVFDWPGDGVLRVPGLASTPREAYVLSDPDRWPLETRRHEDAVWITVPERPADPVNTVVVLDVTGPPAVFDPPVLTAERERFVDGTEVRIGDERDDATVRYTTDGSTPTALAPVAPRSLNLTDTTVVAARYFRGDTPLSGERRLEVRRVEPRPAVAVSAVAPGLRYELFEADVNSVDELRGLEPAASGVVPTLDISRRSVEEHFGFRFTGLIRVQRDGMYRFSLSSDDGATLRIGGELVVDHDGIHAAYEKTGSTALAAGLHRIEVLFFEKGGHESLDLWIEGPDLPRRAVGPEMLLHETGSR
jgi:alpha-L-fucosidase